MHVGVFCKFFFFLVPYVVFNKTIKSKKKEKFKLNNSISYQSVKLFDKIIN